ncbi:uncharacterized protein AKAME5_000709100, partial [Lates japonicus]
MEQVGNRIICSSEGIYPEPDLTWSTRPPSNLTLQNQTSIQQTEQQLYNISSSLILSDSETDLSYICTISTRKNWRRVTLFITTSISVSDSETTISCTASDASITGFSLTWRFNHSQIILNQSRADISYTVSEVEATQYRATHRKSNRRMTRVQFTLLLEVMTFQWMLNLSRGAPVSKVNMEQVGNRIICSSEGIYPEPDLTWSTRPTSNLNLQKQTSIQQTEQQLYNICSSLILSDSETDLIYICTISTHSNSRDTTLFKTKDSTNVGAIIGGVVGTILVLAAVVFLVLYCKKKTGRQENNRRKSNSEGNPDSELHRKSNRRMARDQFTLLLEVMTFQWMSTLFGE